MKPESKMHDPIPVFLDCEASSLGSASYPIEIAWNDAAGNIESHLINPGVIAAWTDWSHASEAIHGLSQQYLQEQGEHPVTVAKRMRDALAGTVVYSDNPDWDDMWCRALFKAAGLTIPFEFADSVSLFMSMLPETNRFNETKKALYERLKITARERAGGSHRAEFDVRYLIEFHKLVKSKML